MDKQIEGPPKNVFNYEAVRRDGHQFEDVKSDENGQNINTNNQPKNDKQFLNEMQDLFDT